jgi:hypothetical protein
MRVSVKRQERLERRRTESGAAAILIALLTVVLIGVTAFVTDFGFAYANQRSLQNGVDAAALAVGQEIAVGANSADDCEAVELAYDTSAVESDAANWFQENVPAAVGASAPASLDDFAVECEDINGVAALVVRAEAEHDSRTFFGGIFGHEDIDITTQARVIVGPPATVLGVRPFAICEEVADLRDADPGVHVTVDFDNDDVGCGSADGNFGTLDLRPNPVGSPGNLPQEWTEDGYPDPISVADPMTFEGSPGAPSTNFADEFAAILDEPIVVPVYDSLTSSGSHSVYNITGFVAVTFCGARLNPSTLITGDCLVSNDTTNDGHARWAQVQFTKYIPMGELNVTCEMGDEDCDSGLRVFKLAD